MACCHHDHHEAPPAKDGRYRTILWIALVANAAMFAIEVGAGVASRSVALEADALDFLGDAATYAISLVVLDRALAWRSRAALVKGWAMAAFGAFVLADAGIKAFTGVPPEPLTMGVVGALALATNVVVAVLLFSHRDGDANRQSVWLCSRNDAIGNVAVIAAASGVFATGTAWPDLAVATVMAALALSAAWRVIHQARQELAQVRVVGAPTPAE